MCRMYFSKTFSPFDPKSVGSVWILQISKCKYQPKSSAQILWENNLSNKSLFSRFLTESLYFGIFVKIRRWLSVGWYLEISSISWFHNFWSNWQICLSSATLLAREAIYWAATETKPRPVQWHWPKMPPWHSFIESSHLKSSENICEIHQRENIAPASDF